MIGSIIKGKKNERDIIVISIYNANDWNKIKEIIGKVIEENREGYIIIGEDWNTRTGEKGSFDEEGQESSRKSKDKLINDKGK